MSNEVIIELIKQGPATITLVALVVLAVFAFKYFSVFITSHTARIAAERHEFLQLATSTKIAIERLSNSIEKSNIFQERLCKAVEMLDCFASTKHFMAVKRDRAK